MAENANSPSEILEDRLAFETLITDTSSSLCITPTEHLELVVQQALDRVRDFFMVDRCALLRVSDDKQFVNVGLASYAKGVSHVSADINLAQYFPWSHRRLVLEHKPICIAKMADLPPEADVELEAWNSMQIQSALTLPIGSEEGATYLILLNTIHREREWPDTFVGRLRVLGEMLVGALERQKMLFELREAEVRVKLAADSAEAGLWILDYSTGLFWASKVGRELFGFSPDDVTDMKHLETVVHPEDWNLVLGVIERSAREDEPIDLEYRIIHPHDGSVKWIASRGRPLFTPTGEPERLMGISMDITARKDVEQELLKNEMRLASGADLAGLAFYEVDFEFGVTYTDKLFKDLCGLPPEKETDHAALEFWLEHLHPDDRPRVLHLRQQLHDGVMDRVSLEYRFLNPVRGEIWLQHLACVTKRNSLGATVSTFGVIRETTARHRADEESRNLNRSLIQAHEDERALLARELHDDLTQRLAVLAIDVGRTELAAEDTAQAEAMKAVREDLVRLSEDIHSLAYQLHPSILEELGLAEALRAETERRNRQSQVEFTLDLGQLPPAIGKDVALCLFRVVQEAVNNVMNHASAQTATVTMQGLDDGLALAVRDDGVGFDPLNPGAGRHLGLLSMRERVELVNGSLDIESAPGQGTTVLAWVPVKGVSR